MAPHFVTPSCFCISKQLLFCPCSNGLADPRSPSLTGRARSSEEAPSVLLYLGRVALPSATRGLDGVGLVLFFTQRAQRAQRFITFRIPRLRWSGRKLRYDKSSQRVLSTPSPPCGVLPPVSGGESVTTETLR